MLSITQDDKMAALADAVLHREKEIFAYDMNISNYETMLAVLPSGDWPDEIAQFKMVTLDQVPDQYDEQVSQYQFRDHLKYILKTERAERAKSNMIYQALLSQIPVADQNTAIAAAIVRMNAAKTV